MRSFPQKRSLLTLTSAPQRARGQEVYRDGDRSLSLGLWGQSWYQFVEGGGDEDAGGESRDLHDFMLRRLYFSVRGSVTPSLGFFVHLAGDRLGQRQLDRAGLGLGTGLAVRDAWVTLRLAGQAAQLQVGRMYIPFTLNPGNRLRTAGRLTLSLFEPETGWFNQGSSLGRRRTLTLGAGVDRQRLGFQGEDRDYLAWTVDLHLDHPLTGGGAVTVNGSYIGIENAPNGVALTALGPGSDAGVLSLQAGYLLAATLGPGRLQPFGRFEWIGVRGRAPDTRIGGVGFNLFLAGHGNKLTVEATLVDQEGEAGPDVLREPFLLTAQLAFGM